MREWQSQSHVKWYCRYHVVFTPKYRKKAIFASIRKGIGKILRELCEQKKIELVEGHALSDHVHLCLRSRRGSCSGLHPEPRGRRKA
jgi:putative transposase